MDFQQEVQQRILSYADNLELQKSAREFLGITILNKYCYNYSWASRPIIQYPQDICAMQEIIYKIKPDLIIETGIAHGGSLIFSAAQLALLDYCENIPMNKSKRRVLGIDIDIRAHNKQAILEHPLSPLITMFEGSSVAQTMIQKVRDFANNYNKILVCLDSCHTHEHVLKELEAYAPLVSENSYCVVFDTIIETLPADVFTDERPWHKGNSPMTAVNAFLENHPEFEVDPIPTLKTLITSVENGFLRRKAKIAGGGVNNERFFAPKKAGYTF